MWGVDPRRTEGGTAGGKPPDPGASVPPFAECSGGIQVRRRPCPSVRHTGQVALRAVPGRVQWQGSSPPPAVITLTADDTSRHGTHLDTCLLNVGTRVPTVITGERAVDVGGVRAVPVGGSVSFPNPLETFVNRPWSHQ